MSHRKDAETQGFRCLLLDVSTPLNGRSRGCGGMNRCVGGYSTIACMTALSKSLHRSTLNGCACVMRMLTIFSLGSTQKYVQSHRSGSAQRPIWRPCSGSRKNGTGFLGNQGKNGPSIRAGLKPCATGMRACLRAFVSSMVCIFEPSSLHGSHPRLRAFVVCPSWSTPCDLQSHSIVRFCQHLLRSCWPDVCSVA